MTVEEGSSLGDAVPVDIVEPHPKEFHEDMTSTVS